MIKIIHVLTDKNIGGAGRWLLSFLKHYDKNELEISVIVPEGSLLAPRIRALGEKLIELPGFKEASKDQASVSKLKDIFIGQKPDIIHTHASLSARIAAQKAGIISVNTKHCMEEHISNPIKRFAKNKINKKYSAKVIAVSEAVAESLKQEGMPEEKIEIVYGAPVPVVKASFEERELKRKEMGLLPEDFAVGIIARLAVVKDHPTFLRAAAKVQKTGLPIKFFVIGSGECEANLKAMAKELSLENTLFMGFIEDIDIIYNALDLNVLTSKSEALSLSLIEGMTVGLPALGSDTGGIGEVITEGVTGELFPVGDSEALAEKILKLYKDKELYAKYSENAEKNIKERFSAQVMCKKMTDIYKRLIEGGGKA